MEKTAKKRIPLTKIQKLIGKRMLASKRDKPCFYLQLYADVTEMMAMRPKLRKDYGIKITTNCFYIRSLALAAKKYPLMLGRFEDDNIRIPNNINVGFAVNAPQGLVVPVLKKADKKSMPEIAREEKLLTEKARDNKLKFDDISDETIALSYLGPYGIDSFLAIVPPQTSTILAVGNILHEAVPKNGCPEERKKVSLTIAADHRVIDGAYAAKFLNFLKEQLQNPKELL